MDIYNIIWESFSQGIWSSPSFIVARWRHSAKTLPLFFLDINVIRSRIEKELMNISEGDILLIDFSRIGVIDYSCSDEIITKLKRQIKHKIQIIEALK